MEYGKDPHLVGSHPEDDSIVTDTKLPITPERAGQGNSVLFWACAQSGFDRARDPRSHQRWNRLDVSVSDVRVVPEGVSHLACLDGPRSPGLPDRPMTQRSGSVKGSRPLVRDRTKEAILLHLEGGAQEISGGRRKRSALASCHPSERVVDRPFEHDIHARVLCRHRVSVAKVVHRGSSRGTGR